MLLTLSTTHRPASDLGYLLHKHPSKLQTFPLGFGQAHVFYPQVSEERCTAALMLDINPIGLIRSEKGADFALAQYVNDRPYVASSFLSVAIAKVYGSALEGKSKDRPDLAAQTLPFEAVISALPSRDGADLIRRLFAPLGYAVDVQEYLLDEAFPEWGVSPYYTVSLAATCLLSELLSHLYVLIPVLDDKKHYWVGSDEVEKLLRRGEGWLVHHPERALIMERYLKHRHNLMDEALERLLENGSPETAPNDDTVNTEDNLERRISLNDQRLAAVASALTENGTRRIIDLGCGEGKLIRRLVEERSFEAITGMDVSHRALETAKMRLEYLAPMQRTKVDLFQGSLIYRDSRLAGYDGAAVVEVIEHLDPSRLVTFTRVLFEFARPRVIVLTTPNSEYNVLFPGLVAGAFRHPDHRFEWSRNQFQAWAQDAASRFGYQIEVKGIGETDLTLGSPSQMAVFRREDGPR